MKDIEKLILEEVNNDHDYVVSLRRHFHAFPELSKKEYNTALKIEEELDKIGLPHKRVDETGVYSEIKGLREGNDSIILRADIDALPIIEEHHSSYESQNKGVMHACGHDAHTAGLIGAARILVKNRDKFGGTIKLHFQQAEEVGYGAKQFVKYGYLDKKEASRTFGIHLASNIEAGKIALVPGPNNAAVDWFRINVHGLACHVSTPERGVDAAYVAAQILIGVQSLVTRRENPIDSVLIGIGKITAGTAYNIVAQEASLEGTIRTLNENTRAKVKKDLINLANLTAQIYGATVDFEWNDNTSSLNNDEKSTIEAQKVAFRLFGNDNVIVKRDPALGGDDFAEYINRIPGVYGYVGSQDKNRRETCVAHHDSHFDIDESCLKVSTAILATYAIEYLNKDID